MKPVLVLLACLAIGLVLVGVAELVTRDRSAETYVPHPASPMIAVTFAHADHTDQNCVLCHHNYVDDTGQGMCFDCHKTDPEVSALIEEQFHDLCRGCHIEEQELHEAHGPTRQCYACHQPDQHP